MSLDTLPVAELRNRTYQWVGYGRIYIEDVLTDVTYRADGYVEFHTDSDVDGFTFGISSHAASWHREANGNIVVSPDDPKAGRYIFLQRT